MYRCLLFWLLLDLILDDKYINEPSLRQIEGNGEEREENEEIRRGGKGRRWEEMMP
jgi:hypothetical protein